MDFVTIVRLVGLIMFIVSAIAIGITSYNKGYSDCLEDLDKMIDDIETKGRIR